MHTGVLQGRRRRLTRVFVLAVAVLVVTACANRPPAPIERPESAPAPAAPVTPVATTPATEAPRAPRAPVVIEGSGGLIASPTTPAQAGESTGDGFQLNFVDTEVATVVSTVLGDGLNVPFVVDPHYMEIGRASCRERV